MTDTGLSTLTLFDAYVKAMCYIEEALLLEWLDGDYYTRLCRQANKFEAAIRERLSEESE